MAAIDTMIGDIPAYFLVIVALGVLIMLFVGGLLNADKDITVKQQADYQTAIVMENLLNLKASGHELDSLPSTEGYSYNERRAALPVEYFTVEAPSEDSVGYRIDGEHCYIPRVPQLDGGNYSFRIVPLDDPSRHATDPKKIPDVCRGMDFSESELERLYLDRSVVSPVMLIRKDHGNPPLPARIFVYRQKSWDDLTTLNLN